MLRLTLAFFALTTLAPAQESTPSVVKEKVRQWIQAKKTIAEESARWEGEKQMLNDLISLRLREAKQMNEVISLAKERVADIEKKSSSLEEETRQRQVWRSDFEKRVKAIEDALIPQMIYLPSPLKNKVFEAVERLKNRDDGGELQGRFRDVLAILNECIAFNSQTHTIPEIREVDGRKMEVDVIYLGMNQAWYVDRTNKRAGIGSPTKDGWVWKDNPTIAGKVRRAIDIQTKKEAPAFAKLPLE